jgi:hypothetical protein
MWKNVHVLREARVDRRRNVYAVTSTQQRQMFRLCLFVLVIEKCFRFFLKKRKKVERQLNR